MKCTSALQFDANFSKNSHLSKSKASVDNLT